MTATDSTRSRRLGSRIAKTLFAAGLLSVCLVTFGVFWLGAREPREHSVRTERVLAVPVDSVWARLLDFEAYPAWRQELAGVKVEESAGDTLVYQEYVASKPGMRFRVEQQQAPSLLVVRNISEKFPLDLLWTWELEALPEGCRVRLSESGAVNSVTLRFYYRYVNSNSYMIEKRLSQLAESFTPS
ncbi:MAG: SRPBCC family protein [Calditrichaeota bacterium]|nr:SRPBCC family protein [Candidatus Cloacimonadota bacterium]MCA9785586.1 SRPBCC family protein [Candidatus Cloacimonadota bacterium]MCB1047788.1 SRPBCC family protein [Calditrichota bacterium]MCB9473526.1 SRPBCC family protein [Candidatus Delongbacteria bacterium]